LQEALIVEKDASASFFMDVDNLLMPQLRQ